MIGFIWGCLVRWDGAPVIRWDGAPVIRWDGAPAIHVLLRSDADGVVTGEGPMSR